ncbi:hypothetical protein [Puerhibacterium sp. TATVAM-FAB25]|uniref:hypothetical protein n=1 Tax=Puerhibacterium sp. TATVAM-FAB25 TaxID=3093699 RepID=UPI00397D20FD
MLTATEYQAEETELAGSASVVDLSLAEGGQAVAGVGGEPGNDSSLTFSVDASEAGPHAVVFRFSNPEQVDGTHYNPNPVARHADISVNDGDAQRVLFVPTFHENNFWERTVVLDLHEGENTISLRSQEATNWDGETYASELWPADYNLRADEAPIVNRITVSPLSATLLATPASPVDIAATGVCRGPRAFLEVKVTNSSDRPVGVAIATDHGTRERGPLAAGKEWRQTFPTKSGALDAGTVTVTADGVEATADYEGVSCG